MDTTALREWRWRKQGLDGSLKGRSCAEALQRSGWSRSVGGANPYLALFARTGASFADVNRAAQDLQIQELPSARGCTYVLPASDYAVGLLCIGDGAGEAAIRTAIKHLGFTEAELEDLCDSILSALADGSPKDTNALKAELGGLVRAFGEEGKKRGTTSSLSLGLGRLRARGLVRQVSANGRLDTQKYDYALWEESPLAGNAMTRDKALARLAGLYWTWIGPATMKEFQGFSGLSGKAAAAATAQLGLVELADGLLCLPSEVEALRRFRPSDEPSYSLVGCLDSIHHLRADTIGLLNPDAAESEVWSRKGVVSGGGLTTIECGLILDRGSLIGLWDYDPEAPEVVWLTFDGDRPAGLKSEVARVEQYVAEGLGDVRSFSLDSPASRKVRLAALRA